MNNKYILLAFIIIFLLTLQFKSKAENRDTTLHKINENMLLIKEASAKFNINYKILCSVIFVERTLNYNWEDSALDVILAEGGLNSSIGFCQVKMKTAYWIERQLNDKDSKYYCGKKYQEVLKVSRSPGEIIKKLENDSLNPQFDTCMINYLPRS
jgi:hypothetical protein